MVFCKNLLWTKQKIRARAKFGKREARLVQTSKKTSAILATSGQLLNSCLYRICATRELPSVLLFLVSFTVKNKLSRHYFPVLQFKCTTFVMPQDSTTQTPVYCYSFYLSYASRTKLWVNGSQHNRWKYGTKHSSRKHRQASTSKQPIRQNTFMGETWTDKALIRTNGSRINLCDIT